MPQGPDDARRLRASDDSLDRATRGIILRALRRWERLWDDPGLSSAIRVELSSRLRRTLGRATPATGRIVLHPLLLSAWRDRLVEVLCHEAAHISAVRGATRRGEATPAAHGPKWSGLILAAGFRPVLRLSPQAGRAGARELPPVARSTNPTGRGSNSRKLTYRCPVCQNHQTNVRRRTRWHCDECARAGLRSVMVPDPLIDPQ